MTTNIHIQTVPSLDNGNVETIRLGSGFSFDPITRVLDSTSGGSINSLLAGTNISFAGTAVPGVWDPATETATISSTAVPTNVLTAGPNITLSTGPTWDLSVSPACTISAPGGGGLVGSATAGTNVTFVGTAVPGVWDPNTENVTINSSGAAPPPVGTATAGSNVTFVGTAVPGVWDPNTESVTINATGGGGGGVYTLNNAVASPGETIIASNAGTNWTLKRIVAGTGIGLTSAPNTLTVSNTAPSVTTTLGTTGTGTSIVTDGTGPTLQVRSFAATSPLTVSINGSGALSYGMSSITGCSLTFSGSVATAVGSQLLSLGGWTADATFGGFNTGAVFSGGAINIILPGYYQVCIGVCVEANNTSVSFGTSAANPRFVVSGGRFSGVGGDIDSEIYGSRTVFLSSNTYGLYIDSATTLRGYAQNLNNAQHIPATYLSVVKLPFP